MRYLRFLLLGLVVLALGALSQNSYARQKASEETTSNAPAPLLCVAFGPYVDDLNPDYGPHPSHARIDDLLDVVVDEIGARCILSYGVLNGLDYTVEAAASRGLKVVQVVWLTLDPDVNDASIQRGTELALAYPDTIIRLSCGSEMRTRYGPALDADVDAAIGDCISRLRDAGVPQPITTIETWWEWCGRSGNVDQPCQGTWGMASDVDWIGVNVFPWWENKYSGIFPCTPASNAAAFHIERVMDVAARYPGKEIVLTEFGWPAGPDGYAETNDYTGQQCGIASEDNQRLVIRETLAALSQSDVSGVLFEAFREGSWKESYEGPMGTYWGVCDGISPYTCHHPDLDGDGFAGSVEAFVGTLGLAPCSTTSTANDEEPDAWPPDFDDNQVVNILDVGKVLPPGFGSSPEKPDSNGDGIDDYTPRIDLRPDDVINILDVGMTLPPIFGQTCTP